MSEWISISDRLPEDGQKVLIVAVSCHTIPSEQIEVAIFRKGKTFEENKAMSYSFCDEFGNNQVPYAWQCDHSHMTWFGQNVTHWMELPELPKK